MFKISIFLTFFLMSVIATAQEKPSIGILQFTFKNAQFIDDNKVAILQNHVTKAFVQTRRFTVVDRTIMDAVSKEKELQKTEEFIDGNIIEQGKAIGAKFLISGFVSNTSTENYTSTNQTNGEQKTTYVGIIEIELKVVNVETGETICSESLELRSQSRISVAINGGVSSPGYAIEKAISDARSEIDKFVGRNFPVSFGIVNIEAKDKKGRVDQLLIAGGSEFGLRKGDKLFIFEVTHIEMNGEKLERKKEIGELKILEVEGANFSLCIVKSGVDNVTKKMADKATLIVTTKH